MVVLFHFLPKKKCFFLKITHNQNIKNNIMKNNQRPNKNGNVMEFFELS